MKKAAFLDRDSTINEPYYNEALGILDSPLKVKHFKLLPQAGEAIKMLNDAGYLAVVITNQPAIAKGRLAEEELKRINDKMEEELGKAGAKLDAVYYCPHKQEDNCNCRKPKTELIERAAKDLDIDLTGSYMVGDSWKDVAAGLGAGCKTILLGIEKCDMCRLLEEKNLKPDYIVENLYKAAEIIIKTQGEVE